MFKTRHGLFALSVGRVFLVGLLAAGVRDSWAIIFDSGVREMCGNAVQNQPKTSRKLRC